MCGNAILHEEQFSMMIIGIPAKKYRHVAFQESFAISSCKPIWKYVGLK
jgi:hypothetical protein